VIIVQKVFGVVKRDGPKRSGAIRKPVTPPFFRKERIVSNYVGCPQDGAESDFYSVSLPRKYYFEPSKCAVVCGYRWRCLSKVDRLRV